MKDYTSERLTLTNQLIELQGRGESHDRDYHIKTILQRLEVLDKLELSQKQEEEKYE